MSAMHPFLELIRRRTSVETFDSRPIDDETIRALVEDAARAPSSFNIQHWRFVVVRDPELRKEIRAAGNDQAQMTDASLLIVITADVKAWQKDPSRYWRNAPTEVAELLVNWMGPFHEGNEQLQRDEAMRSIGIAMQTIMIAATDMGYQSCPMIGFDPDKVAKLINLPDDHMIVMLIVVGKAAKPARPRAGQLPLEEVVTSDRF